LSVCFEELNEGSENNERLKVDSQVRIHGVDGCEWVGGRSTEESFWDNWLLTLTRKCCWGTNDLVLCTFKRNLNFLNPDISYSIKKSEGLV
jgi:hypothetical protein